MGPNCAMLLKLIITYRLDNRNEQVALLRRRLEAGRVRDDQARRYILQLQPLIEYVIHSDNFLDRPPTQKDLLADGPLEIELGKVMESEGIRFGLTIQGRWPTILVAGSAGSGKTVLLRQLIKKVHKWNQHHPGKRIVLIIIDVKKDFYDLPTLLGDEFVLYSVHHGLRLGFNGPEDLAARIWINQLTRALSARLGLIAARTTVASVIHWSLPLLNPDPARKPLRYPTPRFILKVLSRAHRECFSAKADYSKWLFQASTGMVQDSGDLYDCANGLEINRDIIARGKHLILDVSNLPDYLRNFIIDQKLLDVMVPRLERGLKSANETTVFFVVGECDQLLKGEKAYTEGLSPFSSAIRLGREEKVMFAIEVSALENAPPQVLIDARDIFIFNMSNANSVRIAREILQIDPRCDRLIASLQPGECLVRSTQSPWPFTFLGKSDFMPPARAGGAIEYSKPRFILPTPFDQLPRASKAIEQLNAQHNKGKLRQKHAKNKGISKDSRDFLQLRSRFPFSPDHETFAELGITSGSVKTRIKKELTKHKLIKSHGIRDGRRVNTFSEPTDAGYCLAGTPCPKGQGKGDFEHRRQVYRAKTWHERQGHMATIEDTAPGTNHRFDLLVHTPNEVIAYEIASKCIDNLPHHVHACFVESDTIDKMIIVAATKAELHKIQRQLQADETFVTFADRIRFETVGVFGED